MRDFRKHKTAIFLIGATLVLAIVIGIFGAIANSQLASFPENAVETITNPGQTASGGLIGWFRNIFVYFGSVKTLREENAALEKANIELDKKVRDMQGLEDENEQLRAMLGLIETEVKLDVVAARVVGKDPSNWYSSFTINKGTNDGIQKNQPVFTGDYELIGRVYKVGSNWAEVITVLDPESSVGSTVMRTKDIGILEGDSSLRFQGLCRLSYLSRDTEIAVGDYVETSGLGGVFPKGLLIGKVTSVEEDNATMSKIATVEPLADIDRITDVLVLKNFTEEIKPTVDPKEKEEKEKEKKEDASDQDRDDDSESSQQRQESSSSESQSSSRTESTPAPSTTPTPRPEEPVRPAPEPAAPSQPAPAPSGGSSESGGMNGTELME